MWPAQESKICKCCNYLADLGFSVLFSAHIIFGCSFFCHYRLQVQVLRKFSGFSIEQSDQGFALGKSEAD